MFRILHHSGKRYLFRNQDILAVFYDNKWVRMDQDHILPKKVRDMISESNEISKTRASLILFSA